MELGLGHLAMMPDQFWSLTMPEFNAKLSGFKEFHGIKEPEEPIEVVDIEDMMLEFPDGPIEKHRRLAHKRAKRDHWAT